MVKGVKGVNGSWLTALAVQRMDGTRWQHMTTRGTRAAFQRVDPADYLASH